MSLMVDISVVEKYFKLPLNDSTINVKLKIHVYDRKLVQPHSKEILYRNYFPVSQLTGSFSFCRICGYLNCPKVIF